MPESPGMAKRRGHGEGTIYWDDARKRYVGQLMVDGKRRKVVAKTKTDCAARLSELRNAPAEAARARSKLTVAELLDDWMARDVEGRGLAPSTLTVLANADAHVRGVIEKLVTGLHECSLARVEGRG